MFAFGYSMEHGLRSCWSESRRMRVLVYTYEHPTETASRKVILDVDMLRTAVKDWNFDRGDTP